ncbi:hypothetical protein HDV05_006270 [Chytridiales sp. JEL 0842]|nr:hypothetical protein HDV05_006270 [Chytridiales sp. JEL 0842]
MPPKKKSKKATLPAAAVDPQVHTLSAQDSTIPQPSSSSSSSSSTQNISASCSIHPDSSTSSTTTFTLKELNKLTKPQLSKLALSLGLSDSGKKADLVTLISEHSAASPASSLTTTTTTTTTTTEAIENKSEEPLLAEKDLNKLTVPKLQSLAKSQGITIEGNLRKAEIVQLILNHQTASKPTATTDSNPPTPPLTESTNAPSTFFCSIHRSALPSSNLAAHAILISAIPHLKHRQTGKLQRLRIQPQESSGTLPDGLEDNLVCSACFERNRAFGGVFFRNKGDGSLGAVQHHHPAFLGMRFGRDGVGSSFGIVAGGSGEGEMEVEQQFGEGGNGGKEEVEFGQKTRMERGEEERAESDKEPEDEVFVLAPAAEASTSPIPLQPLFSLPATKTSTSNAAPPKPLPQNSPLQTSKPLNPPLSSKPSLLPKPITHHHDHLQHHRAPIKPHSPLNIKGRRASHLHLALQNSKKARDSLISSNRHLPLSSSPPRSSSSRRSSVSSLNSPKVRRGSYVPKEDPVVASVVEEILTKTERGSAEEWEMVNGGGGRRGSGVLRSP